MHASSLGEFVDKPADCIANGGALLFSLWVRHSGDEGKDTG